MDPGFEGVAAAFRANFAERGDIGAACCVYVEGTPVVDVWAGLADPTAPAEWMADTLQLVFSTTKGATAIVANLLAERGELDLDAPVASYWPEFATNGKADIPVRWVLAHRAGLVTVDGTLTLDQVLAWDPVVAAIAAQAPNWAPGSAHGYHVRTYGWIIGEVVRRVTGRTLGEVFASEVASPLGLDFWIGLPATEESRVSRTVPPAPAADPDTQRAIDELLGGDSLLARALSGPSRLFAYDDMWNTHQLHAAELPSSNGIATARAVARMYAATIGEVDGARLLRDDTLAAATIVRSDGPDRVLGMPMRFGSGFMLAPVLVPGCGPAAFGHAGAGGSLGLADPGPGLAFGYVMNAMQIGLTPDRRAESLVRAVYAALGR